jgi:hypothetical protein
VAPTGTDGAPPGWDTNPSTWRQRLPIVALALVGFAIAGYLTLYQIDVIDTVWEPFFGDGSETVLNSSVSHVLPVPDAALGALGYLADAVTGAIGGASLLLVVLQPVAFDSFCTLCLASAVISVLMIGPAMDEVLASLQVLRRAREERRSVWTTFWRGAEAA